MTDIKLWAVKDVQDILTIWPRDCEPVVRSSPLAKKDPPIWHPEWGDIRPEIVARIVGEKNIEFFLSNSEYEILPNTLFDIRLKPRKGGKIKVTHRGITVNGKIVLLEAAERAGLDFIKQGQEVEYTVCVDNAWAIDF